MKKILCEVRTVQSHKCTGFNYIFEPFFTTVELNATSFEYRLIFGSVSDSDIGSYKCEATNDAGTVEDMVILSQVG